MYVLSSAQGRKGATVRLVIEGCCQCHRLSEGAVFQTVALTA